MHVILQLKFLLTIFLYRIINGFDMMNESLFTAISSCLAAPQDAVLRRLDERQEMERDILAEVAMAPITKVGTELRDIARNSAQYERKERLDALAEKRLPLRATPGECH